ncbi:MAG: DciA family protein [Holophagaceae bacterium]
MPRPADRGLRPLGSAAASARAAEAAAEQRLRQAWPLVVGDGLAGRTRLLRVRRGVLVIGAWDLERLPALRLAAASAWPELRARLRHLLGLELAGVATEPCDPPPPPRAAGTSRDGTSEGDPLGRLLRAARDRAR